MSEVVYGLYRYVVICTRARYSILNALELDIVHSVH